MDVSITLPADADDLARFAAAELRRYVRALFASPAVDGPGPSGAIHVIFELDQSLDEQAFLMRPDGEQALRIGGGSGTALLWAVYELVERWGVTYLLHGDVLPEQPGPLRLPDGEIRMEPRLRRRAWRTISTHAFGPESWSLAEYKRFIDQLAKMKINHLHFSMWPWQPFVDYTFRGVRKQSAFTNVNQHLPITDDMVGRELFGDMLEFENPELRGLTRFEDRVAAGQRLVREVMAHGKTRGMTSSIGAHITDWPQEFRRFFPGASEMRQQGRLTFGRAAGQAPDEASMVELARAALRGHFAAYPDADVVFISALEHRDQVERYEWCFQQLDEKYGLSSVRSLADVLRLAEARTRVVGGGAARQVARVKGDIIALYVLDRVLGDPAVLERDGVPPVRIGIINLADELCCYLDRLQPAVAEVIVFVDYTAGRVMEQRSVLNVIPDSPPPSLLYTLGDDNVGIMPQLNVRALVALSREIERRGWNGFFTRYWMIGDHDPAAAAIARVPWDEGATAESIVRDQVSRVCGDAAAPVLVQALDLLEEITHRFDEYGIGFGFPVEGLLMKHWDGRPIADAFRRDRADFEQALALAREALERSRPEGREYAGYYVGRFAFAVGYLDCVDFVHQASVADAAGDRTAALALARTARKRLRQALQAWADVARDMSDLGAIASINEFADRSLRARLEMLAGDAPEDGR